MLPHWPAIHGDLAEASSPASSHITLPIHWEMEHTDAWECLRRVSQKGLMTLAMARSRGHPLRSPEPLLRNNWQAQGQERGQESYPTRSTAGLAEEQWDSVVPHRTSSSGNTWGLCLQGGLSRMLKGRWSCRCVCACARYRGRCSWAGLDSAFVKPYPWLPYCGSVCW